MDEFDHDCIVERDTDGNMGFISDLSDRQRFFMAPVNQGQAAFLLIPVIPSQDKCAKDHVPKIDNVLKEGSNVSSTLRSSNSSQNSGGKLLAPSHFTFSFTLPPLNSSLVGSTASADGSTLPMDVCIPDSATKTGVDNLLTLFSSVTEQHSSRISEPIAHKGLFHVPASEREGSSIATQSIPNKSTSTNRTNLFQLPPPSALHTRYATTVGLSTNTPAPIEYDVSSQQVVTRPLFQLPLPSGPKGPSIVLPNTDTPAAIKHAETQQVVTSSLLQLPPPSAPDHLVVMKPSIENTVIRTFGESQSARPSSHLPLPSTPQNPLITQPNTNTPAPMYVKSQQDNMQHLFDIPTHSAPCNIIAAEPNTDTIATVQDTNVGKEEEENLPPSPPSLTPSLIFRGAPLRYPPGVDPSSPEFIDLLTESLSNLSTPAGILRGHANSLRRSHDETTKRLVENIKNRAVLTNLVTQLESIITLHWRRIFQEHFPRK